jgi:hypothetical protein
VRDAVGVTVAVGDGEGEVVGVWVGCKVIVAVTVGVGVAVRKISPRRLGMLHAPRNIISQAKISRPTLAC